jgi:hypothetical protein
MIDLSDWANPPMFWVVPAADLFSTNKRGDVPPWIKPEFAGKAVVVAASKPSLYGVATGVAPIVEIRSGATELFMVLASALPLGAPTL